jgi:hypothetical protein
VIAGRHIALPGVDDAAAACRVFSNHLYGHPRLAEALTWPIGRLDKTS